MIPLIEPDWPAPPRVVALGTTRVGGVSGAPWDSLNLGDHVGDAPEAVRENRRRLQQVLPEDTRIQWLRQVHGTAVAVAGRVAEPEADACWSNMPGQACAVLTADCLPVLLTNTGGTVVAAAHAGWRGLCAGVIEATIAALPCAPAELMAWLGPAIGPSVFEVGAEVRAAFLAEAASASACFRPASRAGHFLADLGGLARLRLAGAGVSGIYGGGRCTFSETDRFFSYRRDGQTGRMATLICLAASP
jgi:YfiH family protein